ncbi:MAG: hypothetical protein KatS3mg102_2600 [Planctomycetota bacterium]|nr:MAG: hypothetical protein KatS3mg102_2600 [Planctomycetota bacterium]
MRAGTVLGSALAAAALLGASCGGGGSSGRAASQTAIFLKDVPFIVLADGTQVDQLVLRITAVELRDPRTPVPLGAPFKDFDLLTLDSTAALLALGQVPAGVYEKLAFTVDPSGCLFVDANGNAVSTSSQGRVLVVPHSTFEVEFYPPLDTSVHSTIVLDVRPDKILKVVTPGTVYELKDEVDALVAGPPGASGLPVSVPVDDVEGRITALHCPDFTLSFAIDVDTSGARIEDEDTGAVLGCAQLLVGEEVEVEGTLVVGQGGRPRILASKVEVERGTAGGAPGGAGEIELEGRIGNLQAMATPPTFDLVRGGQVIAHVQVAPGAEIEDDPTDRHILVTDLRDGDFVEVEGRLAAPPGAPPLTLVAEKIERK